MLLCNPKHPETFGRWGGCVGDMSITRGCQWFPGTIHSSLHTHKKSGYMRCRIVHEWQGKWNVLFEDLAVCCRHHCEQAITIKMALIAGKHNIPQIYSFPAIRDMKDKSKYDSYTRAFILARKIGKAKSSCPILKTC